MIEMKTFLRTSVFAAVAALMVSCGDGLDAGSCIDSAEESIELKESPLLGELPSLSDQWREAETIARKKADRLYDEYRKQYRNDEIDRETLNDKLSELYDHKDEALKELEEYYYPKMTEIAEELKGKEVPVKFDNAVFKSAKVTITEVSVSDEGYFKVLLDTKLETVGEPDGSAFAYVAQMLDGNGNVLVIRNSFGENVECSTSFGLSRDREMGLLLGSPERLFGDLAYHDGAAIYFGSGR